MSVDESTLVAVWRTVVGLFLMKRRRRFLMTRSASAVLYCVLRPSKNKICRTLFVSLVSFCLVCSFCVEK